jgi:transposase InsO family protein
MRCSLRLRPDSGAPRPSLGPERFPFATLQSELLDRRSWPTRKMLANTIFDYIEAFYNPRRRHSSLAYLSPAAFEAVHGVKAIDRKETAA